jgi:hypothetical protein
LSLAVVRENPNKLDQQLWVIVAMIIHLEDGIDRRNVPGVTSSVLLYQIVLAKPVGNLAPMPKRGAFGKLASWRGELAGPPSTSDVLVDLLASPPDFASDVRLGHQVAIVDS